MTNTFPEDERASKSRRRRACLEQAARDGKSTPQFRRLLQLRLAGRRYKFLAEDTRSATVVVMDRRFRSRKWIFPRLEYSKMRWLEANASALMAFRPNTSDTGDTNATDN